MKSYFKKRNTKVQVLLDKDDFYILDYLNRFYTKGSDFTDLSHIKEYMNFSHNSLLTHTKRLSDLGFIKVIRKSDLNYKYKFIVLTPQGKSLFKCLKEIKILKEKNEN